VLGKGAGETVEIGEIGKEIGEIGDRPRLRKMTENVSGLFSATGVTEKRT
jgi:hypothetical protein